MNQPFHNVVLHPKTIERYEEQLTLYLKQEQYKKAVDLIRFMLQFPEIKQDKLDQWLALQHWLETMFPETVAEEPEDEDMTEQELLRQNMAARASSAGYTDKLLSKLTESKDMGQQLLALEHLAYSQDERAGQTVQAWLTGEERHPFLQVKALQTLKVQGLRGTIMLRKNGRIYEVHIEDTPLKQDEYPVRMQEMIERVKQMSEADNPDFAYFAEQTWFEFLAYAYATPLYNRLKDSTETEVDVWASALHVSLLQKLFGHVDEEELLERYGITTDLTLPWKKAYQILNGFTQTFYPNRNSW